MNISFFSSFLYPIRPEREEIRKEGIGIAHILSIVSSLNDLLRS